MLRHYLITLGSILALMMPAQADTTLKLVEVLTSPERTETLKTIVKQFESANPGVKVEIVSLPWGQAFEKFATMVSSGDTPDIVEMPDKWQALYGGKGLLASLEPYLANWEHTRNLSEKTLTLARYVDNTAYTLPYGFYLRALFYNKKLFSQAGIAAPPTTMNEFWEYSKKISAIPGKYGYCLRGGPGGLNGWVMFAAAMNGDNNFFTDKGVSTFTDANWVKGITYLADLYKAGYAPKDSVNWGFNEVVTGFYSGTCAMLDQDPDALIAIDDRMNKDDYGVAPMPKGESGKAFPTIGYAGWSMFASSPHKDLSWKLIAALEGPEGNIIWNKRIQALPIYKAAEQDAFYADPKFKGWFEELADKNITPTLMPTFLQGFGYFADVLVVKTSQQLLLGQIKPEAMAAQWAAYLTKAHQQQTAKP